MHQEKVESKIMFAPLAQTARRAVNEVPLLMRSRKSSGIYGSRRFWLGMLSGVVLFLLPLVGQSQGTTVSKPAARKPVTPQVMDMDLKALTKEKKAKRWKKGDPVRVIEDLKEALEVEKETTRGRSRFASLQQPVSDFEGIPATGSLPPDTVGDVGPKHYIQMVNTALAIYDKQGNLLAGPSPINSLWSGFGGPCETENNGDPIVRYDHLADRWLLSQFALPGGDEGFHECIAISRTSDPVTGGWYLYDFPTVDTATDQPVFPDYPKIGVWPDAYYMGTQRGFPSGGLDVWAFERDKMLLGAPAAVVQFHVSAPSLFLMPSDLDGSPPPTGTPNFFLRQVDGERFGGGGDRLEVFAFSVDWTNPVSSTFAQVASLPTTPFDSVLCSADLMGACVPQPGTDAKLETLTVWPMWRLQYRSFGTHEALVINHTVDADGQDHAGIRWYELRRSAGGAWSIAQQGTHAPDKVHRWMGSIAMDQGGGIALGYSVSSDTLFPGIRYASRLVSDPPGTLAQGEVTLVTGAGSQTFSRAPRWGNYSSMDVDPVDGCTFWYTTEYYDTTSAAGWKTRISSFKHPSCGEPSIAKEIAKEFEYSAKIVCGLQKDSRDMRMARGFYASAINIRNPNAESVEFDKELALTFPPEEQRPGQIIPIAADRLGPDEALEVDCMDIQRRLFPNGFPASYIKGFVVIQSNQRLDVTAVYTTASLNEQGEVAEHSGIDIERVRGRVIRSEEAPKECPDLTVRDIGPPAVSCPGGPGTCVTKVALAIANEGTEHASAFNVRITLDPGQSVSVNQNVAGGLAAGAEQTLTVTTPPGGNCFDPDCTIGVSVDVDNAIEECNEENNKREETTVG